MKIREMVAVFAILAVFMSAGNHAMAQTISPFGDDAAGLMPEELELMKGAIWDALQAYEPGVPKDWISASGEVGGRAFITEVFMRGEWRCAELVHMFMKGEGRTYTAPFCEVEEGDWKLAF